MTDVEVRLNEDKPHSENRGDMQPDDPHYKVRFWQGEQIRVERKGKQVKAMVLLPFDAEGNLVPDDDPRKEPWQIILPQGPNGSMVQVTHHPLWNDDMRKLLAKKVKELEERDEDEDDVDIDWATSRINFIGWLTGTEKYPKWHIVQAGARKTFSKVFPGKRELVIELVEERKLVSPEAVCKELAGYLTQAAA